MMDVADLRREYSRGGLHRANLPAEPLALLRSGWRRLVRPN